MKKILAIVAAFAVVAFNGFMLMEGAVSNAATDNFDVTLTVTSELALACDNGPISLGSIAGMTGGTATNTALCTVDTNNDTGYTMTVNTDSANCLNNATNSIDDYPSATPQTWNLGATTNAYFGFTVTGADKEAAFAAGYYRGFDSTNAITIASSTNETATGGTGTTLGFQVQLGSTANQATGAYVAPITVTATTNP